MLAQHDKRQTAWEQSLITVFILCQKKLSRCIIYWIYLSRQDRDKDHKYFSLKDFLNCVYFPTEITHGIFMYLKLLLELGRNIDKDLCKGKTNHIFMPSYT